MAGGEENNERRKEWKKGMKNKKKQGTTGIGESMNISIHVQIKTFLDSDTNELKFSSFLTSTERCYIHQMCTKFGLKSKSRGKGADRYITVYKRSGSTLVQTDAKLILSPEMQDAIGKLMISCPITIKEKDDLTNNYERERMLLNNRSNSFLTGSASVPNTQINPDVIAFKKTLPVYAHRQAILDAVNNNQVVIIVGETGSGKTTQIPQYLFEQAQEEKKKCKIVCTEPRRIAAVSVAERVAYERREKCGESVGYHIRLESRVSQKTVLTYCTTGVLLRAFMSIGSSINSITHIIIDEIHERDKLCDFLLISLKEVLVKFKDLKVILMSATINPELFTNYFNGCPVLKIPGKIFPIQKFYLEDILAITQYSTPKMKELEKQLKILSKVTDKKNSAGTTSTAVPEPVQNIQLNLPIDPEVQAEMDDFLNDCLVDGSEDSFGQIIYMYSTENVPVNCAHSSTGMTSLMAAAHHGKNDVIEEILQLGADPEMKDMSGKKALDYATANGKDDCVNFLNSIQLVKKEHIQSQETVDQALNSQLQSLSVDDVTLESYYRSIEADSIDHNLILELTKQIHLTQPAGSILIFMPGFDDIMTMKELVETCSQMLQQKYQIFTLHSNMQMIDQKRIFTRMPGIRKIFISTNIAETSITIDDVVYVIDCGMAKEMYFDSTMGVCSLEVVWISKSCALQRAGRAGRTQAGKVYLMCSRKKFQSFQEESTPEILRVPLHDLCLHAKHLAVSNTPIAEFLAKAIEPPSFTAVRNSVTLLKTIGALSPTEDLTEIGHNLLEISIEPQLGKMLLYACVLKCLDPILTIVCTISYKEPFQISSAPDSKKLTANVKKEFSANTLSDHMVMLRAFQGWQKARANNSDKTFSKKYLINIATMKTVESLRIQVLSQLRALGLVKPKGPGDIKDCNQNSNKWEVIKAVLVAGLYPGVARVDRDCMTLRTSKEVKVQFQRGSVLHKPGGNNIQIKALNDLPSDWIVFEEVNRKSQTFGCKSFIHSNTVVTGMTIALFGGPLRLPVSNIAGISDDSDSDEETVESSPDLTCFSLDDWIVFTATPQDALSTYLLRQKFSALMIRRMQHPGKPNTPTDDKVIATVVNILSMEEKRHNLAQPSQGPIGIQMGQRVRMF